MSGSAAAAGVGSPVVASSNLDHAVDALVLIRDAQRAVDAALRLPNDDRAALHDQVEAVRGSTAELAAALAARPELRALGGMVSFFAQHGSQALGAVSGAAASLGQEPDPSLDLSERIAKRLEEVGVSTRSDLAHELAVDPRSREFRDALERTLGTGRAEWYGSGTYGLPRAELETLIARAGTVSDEAGAGATEAGEERRSAPNPGSAISDLRAAVDALLNAVAQRDS